MPTLNKYVPSSSKSGYYIRANVGTNHPITLQTTGLGTRILQEAEFTDGDIVPTKLVWSLFDIGLLYTQSTHHIPEDQSDIRTAFEQNISAKLTAKTKQQLMDFLDTYEGENQEKVKQLKADLEAYQPVQSDTAHRRTDDSNERFQTPYPTDKDELISLLYVWTNTNSPDGFRTLKQRVEKQLTPILYSVQSIYHHPHLQPSATVTQYCSVEYTLETDEWGTIIVEDFRHLVNNGNDDEDLHFRINFLGISGRPTWTVVAGEIHDSPGEQIDEDDVRVEILEDIEWVNSPNIESIESALQTIQEFIDLDKYTDLIRCGDQDGFGKDGINLPHELLEALEAAEHVDIDPMYSFPDPNEGGSIFIGKVDRISNNGNPIVELSGAGHTILQDGEEGQYYVIYNQQQGQKSRPLGKITVVESA